MIWESHYWKKPLLEMADRLERLKASDDLSDEQMAQIERDVFIGFYSVRKLFEAPTKVTDQTRRHTLSLQRHSNIKPVTWRNHHKLDELYDLSKSGNEIRDVLFICGRLIHSFVFAACVSDTGGLHGAFFNSDRDKDSCLYFITIDAVISLFRIVGNDDPCHIEWSRNEGSGEGRLVVR